MTIGEYNKIHAWVRKNFVKKDICESCGKHCRTEWSNKSGEYKRDINDFQELCRGCHKKYDKEKLGSAKGKGVIEGMTIHLELEVVERIDRIASIVAKKYCELRPVHIISMVLAQYEDALTTGYSKNLTELHRAYKEQNA